jgi:hypothetical protein
MSSDNGPTTEVAANANEGFALNWKKIELKNINILPKL